MHVEMRLVLVTAISAIRHLTRPFVLQPLRCRHRAYSRLMRIVRRLVGIVRRQEAGARGRARRNMVVSSLV
jgi:hypothetical protein